ncbi:MAG: outer membrane protein assembly factor BamE [Proteobacteria bacterium]|nr:outer membrane protein assembly factor BamE [Pseudomonadota bacterium]
MKHFFLAILAISITGCSMPQLKLPDLKVPRVYKLSVQQGNVITQEMVDRLEPGMSRNQVEYVMGRPVLQDPFNQDEWVYLYSLEVPDLFTQAFKMVLTFDDDTLVTIAGDYVPGAAEAAPAEDTPVEGAPGEDSADAADSGQTLAAEES